MIEVLSEWTSNIYVIGRNVASDDRNLQINVSEDEHHQTFNFIVPMQLICGEIPNLRGVNPSIPKDPQFHMKLGSKRFNK
ncbi:hypothetical protein CLOBI_08920 [Clostridium beijerinckii]|nr:hypothetical protein CLOBI_08920 [Clostridium beijerinckii]